MLEPGERSVLRQMSVFRGGCTREAAEAVTGAGLAELTALVDSSWLRLRASGRYDMHELVRQYCGERRDTEHETASGEEPAEVSRRHCNYYAFLLQQQREQSNFGSDFIRLVAPEFGNIQIALDWATHLSYLPTVYPLVFGVWFTGHMLGWHEVAYESLTTAANILESQPDRLDCDEDVQDEINGALAAIRNQQITLSSILGMFQAAKRHIHQLDALVEAMKPGRSELYYRYRVSYEWCIQTWQAGDFVAARYHGLHALSLCKNKDFVCPIYGREKGQTMRQADVLAAIGYANLSLGDYREAERCWRSSIVLADTIGERRGRAQHCGQLARMLVTVGTYEQAEQASLASYSGKPISR